MSHMRLIKQAAKTIARRLPPGLAEQIFDDMVQYAALGVLRAKKKFDPSRGITFEQYAWHRALGAVLDGLREMSPISRYYRKVFPDVQHVPFKPNSDMARSYEVDYLIPLRAEEVLSRLPPRLRRVSKMYYLEELTLAEIGKRLELSESRICQLMKEARPLMREGG